MTTTGVDLSTVDPSPSSPLKLRPVAYTSATVVVGLFVVGDTDVGLAVGEREVGDDVGASVGQAGHITGGGGEHTGHAGQSVAGGEVSQHTRQASCGSRPLDRFSSALRSFLVRDFSPA
jgi:hypothetical protein